MFKRDQVPEQTRPFLFTRTFSLQWCSLCLCQSANVRGTTSSIPFSSNAKKKRIHSSDRGDVDVVPGEAVNLERGSFYGLNQRVTADSKHHQRRNKRQTRTEIEASFLSGSIAAVDVATYKYGPSHHCVPYVHHVSYSSVIDSKKTCVLFFFFERERERESAGRRWSFLFFFIIVNTNTDRWSWRSSSWPWPWRWPRDRIIISTFPTPRAKRIALLEDSTVPLRWISLFIIIIIMFFIWMFWLKKFHFNSPQQLLIGGFCLLKKTIF